MDISNTVKKYGINKMIDYALKDPKKNFEKILDWADTFAGDDFASQRKGVRQAMTNPESPYYDFIHQSVERIDHHVLKTLSRNLFFNASLIGGPIHEKLRQEYNCNIPWTILLDPTSACNMNCKGCWAAEYGNKLNLTYKEIDDIISQGKELGVYMYIYTGGEPLVRKNDLIDICEKHSDCVFLTFTNGTLIDDDFAKEMLRVGNLVPAISLEGFEEATDSRRGPGAYQKVMDAIEVLRQNKLLYGISTCYTSENIDSILSDEFTDHLIELEAAFIWYFHYMPVGKGALPELLPSPEQRKRVFHKIRKNRKEKPLFAMDFQNDAQYVGGCIAGGRDYLHINAAGDIEPCVFIHYSDSNIREKTLLEALGSPLFMAYHDKQPFNENMLRPCPMLENPDKLREIIKNTEAKSTNLLSSESADELCSKCDRYAKNWAPTADKIWKEERADL